MSCKKAINNTVNSSAHIKIVENELKRITLWKENNFKMFRYIQLFKLRFRKYLSERNLTANIWEIDE